MGIERVMNEEVWEEALKIPYINVSLQWSQLIGKPATVMPKYQAKSAGDILGHLIAIPACPSSGN